MPAVYTVADVCGLLGVSDETVRRGAADGWIPAVRVSADEVGRMLRPDYVSVWFPRLCERAGIRRLRFHDLRHTHSTLLAQAGHSMQLVAARMGHSTIQTTANIYSHLAASEDRAAADVLDRIVEEDTL